MAVKVTSLEESSSITKADDANVTVGADSSSVTIIETDCVPSSAAPPPETESIATTAVSSSSYIESSTGVNNAVLVVEPAEIVISDNAS